MLETGKVIAHRGASKYCPENTLVSFATARDLGAKMIEFDVMLSQDGDAFIFHDDILNRTTNARGKFCETSTADLAALDAGIWFSKKFLGVKIPTLTETIEWLTENNMQANIEIKPAKSKEKETTIAVLSHLNLLWPQEKQLPLLSSFDVEIVRLCKTLAPEMPVGLVFDKLPEDWRQLADETGCYSIHLNYRKLAKKDVEDIHKANIKVFAYTVNSKRKANKMFKWGVDAIFSDYTDLIS